mgnify:CR=1 FL=1
MGTFTPSLLLDDAELARCREFLEPRANAADRGDATFCDAAKFIAENVLGENAGPPEAPNQNLERVVSALATIGWFDMGTAFSLWCQRMVLEFLSKAPSGSACREEALDALRRGERVGTSAMAGPMAHFVSGVPLTLKATPAENGEGYRISGVVAWASNLAEGKSIIVSVAARESGEPVVFATPIEAPGIRIGSFSPLIAMQGTLSTSMTFEDVEVPASWVITENFRDFMTAIRPIFLLLQSSYCWGLAARSVAESEQAARGVAEVFRDEITEAHERVERQAERLLQVARARCEGVSVPELLDIRLEAAKLATDCTSLESRVIGGRSYIASCETSRRLREALFLPVQAPTEGQLRWERSQYD